MRSLFIHISIPFLLASCSSRPAEKPAWINQTAELSFPNCKLVFKSSQKNWSAGLLSFTQPVRLNLQYNDSGFVLSAKQNGGITEGPAQIFISNGKAHFYYPVNLVNSSVPEVSKKDYRSPKTVNPDSSLYQQSIVHETDTYRNLATLKNRAGYFFEEEIRLSPKTGIFRAVETEALTSFYVQAGSCTGIPLTAVYKPGKNVFEVTAGPLRDRYNNTVANGTQVTFLYDDAGKNFRMEAALLDGMATVIIPATEKSPRRISAMVDKTRSKTIELTP